MSLRVRSGGNSVRRYTFIDEPVLELWSILSCELCRETHVAEVYVTDKDEAETLTGRVPTVTFVSGRTANSQMLVKGFEGVGAILLYTSEAVGDSDTQ